MIELGAPHSGETVLELAAGPGDTGFAAAELLGDGGRLLSTDFAPEMVETARRLAARHGLGNVDFAVVDATAIPLPDAGVDLVLCRFGLMLIPDMAGVAAEIARVLRPGGRAVLAVWAEPERNPWIGVLGTVARTHGWLEPPEPDAPGPFRLSDPARFRAVVESGGLHVESLEEVPVEWHASSRDEWWETVLDMSPTAGALAAELGQARFDELRILSEQAIDRFVQPDGSVHMPGVAHVLLATAE